jgi:nucleoside-diphosphate-sugar epimerase
MKAFVTGCGGYLGSQLVWELLAQDWEVVGLDTPLALRHLLGVLDDPKFHFVPGNVRDHASVAARAKKADVIFPLAAVVGSHAAGGDPAAARAVNADAVVELVRSLSPRQRIVYPMTNSGYGAIRPEAIYTEESPLDPQTEYGKTKRIGEQAVLDHPLGVSLRLASLFGASPAMRWDLLLHDFVRKAVRGERLALYQPDARRNLVHIRDVCRAFRLAAWQLQWRGIYNVGLPECPSKRQIVGRIERMIGVRADVVETDGVDPDKRDYVVSSRRLLETDFVSFRYTLDDGISEAMLVANCLRTPA